MADTDYILEGPVKSLIAAVKAAINAKPSLGWSSTTAKRGDWQPLPSDIVGATSIGTSLLVAMNGQTARTLIGAISAADVPGTGGGSVVISPIDFEATYITGRGAGGTPGGTPGGGGTVSGYVIEGL